MHFFKAILTSAFAATVLAQTKLQFTKAPTNIQAGNDYPIEWEGGDSSQPVTILLKEGPSTNLHTVQTLTADATGGSYTWSVPKSIVSASDYSFQIVQGTATNYWTTVVIAGGSGVASVSSSSASASSSSASASSSSSSAASSSSTSASASASSSSSSSSASSSASSASTRSASSSASASRSSSSASAASASQSSSASTAPAPSSTGNGAENLKSNAALVLGAAAAMAYLA